MKKYKILFDISHGIHGNTGIQQDMRRVLRMLADSELFDIDVLIYDMINNPAYTDYNIQEGIEKKGPLVAQAQLSHHFFNPAGSEIFASRFTGRLRRILHERSIRKNTHPAILSLDKRFNEPFYRKLLMDSHDAGFLEKFKEFNVKLTTYSTEGSILGMMNDNYELPYLDTSEYDAVIFFQELPVRVSANTKKIVRTFDLIQIFGPDVVFKADYKSNYQFKSIKECISQDAHFLPISNTVDKELREIFSVDLNSQMIPVAVSDIFSKTDTGLDFQEFIRAHDNAKEKQSQKISGRKDLKYFLSISTIEPRKNILSAYKAFKKLKNLDGYENYVFLIIGKMGWNLSSEYKQMMSDSDVLVLTNVSTEELPMVYSGAEALVYIPFQEGFGLPPAEAMLCECPVILSDIPVHREIHGNSPLYVNHYEVDLIFKQMLLIADARNSKPIQSSIVNGKKHAQQYLSHNLNKNWQQTLTKIIECSEC